VLTTPLQLDHVETYPTMFDFLSLRSSRNGKSYPRPPTSSLPVSHPHPASSNASSSNKSNPPLIPAPKTPISKSQSWIPLVAPLHPVPVFRNSSPPVQQLHTAQRLLECAARHGSAALVRHLLATFRVLISATRLSERPLRPAVSRYGRPSKKKPP